MNERADLSANDTTRTYYIRDAEGNVLAVYEQEADTLTWREQHLYGSARLGILQPGVQWYSGSNTPTTPFFDSTLYAGGKRYEVTNHLGNVLAVVSDRRHSIDNNSDGEAEYYEPAILSATDYYPRPSLVGQAFGFEMPGRSYSLNAYRYGFNGKEADRGGEWSSLTHYDSRRLGIKGA